MKKLISTLFAALLGVHVGMTPAVMAASPVIVVTTTLDVINAGDGLTSLREAVRLANSRGGADTIQLSAELYPILRPGAGENAASTGDLDVRGPLTIESASGAANTLIDGGGLDRVFEVFNNVSLTLSGVTVMKGMATDGGGVYLRPGAQLVLGGILGPARIEGNEAGEDGGGVYSNGGAILVLGGSAISGNKALGSGAGIFNTNGSVMLDAGFMADNEAGGDGGAIVSLNGAVTLTNGSEIAANRALGAGGGIFNRAGPVTVQAGSAIDGNAALTGDGGGIAHLGGGVIMVSGASTISGNSASGNGGAIANADLTTPGTVDIREGSVLAGNAGFDGGAVFNVGALYLRASRIEGNESVNDGGAVMNHAEGTVIGTMLLEGGSAVANNACSGEAGGIYNRGSLTLAAHSAVTGNYSANGGGGIINDGAMTIAEGSLIADNASGDSGGGFIINGAATLIGTAANPVVIARNFSSDAFGGLAGVSAQATLSLLHVVFEDNGSSDSGGALVNDGGIVDVVNCLFTRNSSSDSGGAIINRPFETDEDELIPGIMTIIDTDFIANASADEGGGLINESQVTVTRARFIDNGGSAIANSGTALVVDTEFRGNSTIDHGGALVNSGVIEVRGGSMTANIAGGEGGAVANVEGGSATLTGVAIFENAARFGAGVASLEADTFLTALTLERNQAAEGAGAILVEGGRVDLTDVIVRNNTTTVGGGGGIASTGGLSGAGGVVRLVRSHVVDNVTGGDGGGMEVGYLGTVELVEGSAVSGNRAGFGGGGVSVDGGTLQLDPTARIHGNTATAGGGVTMGSNLSLLNLGGALLAEVIFGNQPNDLAAGDGTINPLFAAAAATVEIAGGAVQVYLPMIVQD